MSGKKSSLTPLAARKQLLLLESELNRSEFIEAVSEWKIAVRHTKQQVTQLGSMVTTAAKVAGTVAAVRNVFTGAKSGGKKSWLSMLVDGMTTGTSLWYMLRSRGRKQDD